MPGKATDEDAWEEDERPKRHTFSCVRRLQPPNIVGGGTRTENPHEPEGWGPPQQVDTTAETIRVCFIVAASLSGLMVALGGFFCCSDPGTEEDGEEEEEEGKGGNRQAS